MTRRAAVAGGGVAGRLSALLMRRAGWDVTLFDAAGPTTWGGTGLVAGGMLAPYAERENAEDIVMRAGQDALDIWTRVIATLNKPVHFARRGSLVIGHEEDRTLVDDFRDKLTRRGLTAAIRDGVSDELEVARRFRHGFLLQDEGHVDPRELLTALGAQLEAEGVRVAWDTKVDTVEPGRISVRGETATYDVVVDARGLGMRHEHTDLRGVRGEALLVHAPEVTITRPVRLVHPRIPVYVIPRRDQRYYIGASSIESERTEPISVRTVVELLTAATSVHSGFAEATVLETMVGVRPAYPDNLPKLRCDRRGLVAIGGLYRHGFLLAPVLAESVVKLIDADCAADAVVGVGKAFVEEWQYAHSS